MATAAQSTIDSEACIECLKKHNRHRLAVCHCKHCSKEFCMDCIKDHQDEILQDIAQVSHYYNQLQELLQTKTKLITDEAMRSRTDVEEYFKTYIDELHELQRKFISAIETEKQKALDSIPKIVAKLYMIGGKIEELSIKNLADAKRILDVEINLNSIEQLLNVYKVTRTESLLKSKPEFSINFDIPPNAFEETADYATAEPVKEEQICSKDHCSKKQTFAESQNVDVPLDKTSHNTTNELPKIVPVTNISSSIILNMTHTIDRMACDGENFLYTTCFKDRPDLITYHTTKNSTEKRRDWKQSHIVDMIWWKKVDIFICCTDDGIFTVKYNAGGFKIHCRLREKTSFSRVAANETKLFWWISTISSGNIIGIVSPDFQWIETISLNTHCMKSFGFCSLSFCATENIMVSLCTRFSNNREVSKAELWNMKTNTVRSILLGSCGNGIEVRSDGDVFFIITGRQQLYIIDNRVLKKTINLEKEGRCIGILSNRRVAISTGNDKIEIISY